MYSGGFFDILLLLVSLAPTLCRIYQYEVQNGGSAIVDRIVKVLYYDHSPVLCSGFLA
jgi:hypothetical protein